MYPNNPYPGRPYPDILQLSYRTVLEQKAALIEAERSLMAELTQRWLQDVEAKIEPNMQRAIMDMMSRKRRVTPETIARSRQYKSMMRQAEKAINKYMKYAEGRIASFQQFYGELGISDSMDVLTQAYSEYGRIYNGQSITKDFLTNLVGNSSNGSPLANLLSKDGQLSLESMRQAFEKSWRDPEALRLLQDALGQGFNSTVATSRTELFNIYRQAVLEQYRKSGAVHKYVRVATHDNLVCAGCLMAEGETYDVMADFPAHVNCRCMLVPLIGMLVPDWPRGADWFSAQDSIYQRDILGKGRYQGWIDGRYSLERLVKLVQDPEYGPAIVTTPLKELMPA